MRLGNFFNTRFDHRATVTINSSCRIRCDFEDGLVLDHLFAIVGIAQNDFEREILRLDWVVLLINELCRDLHASSFASFVLIPDIRGLLDDLQTRTNQQYRVGHQR